MKEKLYFVLSMVIFGAVGVFAKYIEMSAVEIALLLGLIGTASLSLVPLCKRQKIPWNMIKKNAVVLFAAGVALSGNWVFLFQAYRTTTLANAKLSYYFAPVLVIILSHFVLDEKLSLKKVLCVGVALAGLFLILQNGAQAADGNHLAGIGFGLIAAGFYAALTLLNKFIKGLDGLTITLMQLGLVTILMFPFVLFTGDFGFSSFTGKTILTITMMGILNGGVGFYLFFTGMKKLKAQSIAVLSYIDPLTTLFVSILLIREEIVLSQAIGAALLLGSVWAGEASSLGRSKSERAPDEIR